MDNNTEKKATVVENVKAVVEKTTKGKIEAAGITVLGIGAAVGLWKGVPKLAGFIKGKIEAKKNPVGEDKPTEEVAE